MCLAKGRNADYIQQKLFISSNTAKTHIGHIYKKMGINSQQRLIDLVDHQVDNGDNAPSDSPSNSTSPEVEGNAKRMDTYGSMPIDSKAK